jgi:hypothetical protein
MVVAAVVAATRNLIAEFFPSQLSRMILARIPIHDAPCCAATTSVAGKLA